MCCWFPFSVPQHVNTFLTWPSSERADKVLFKSRKWVKFQGCFHRKSIQPNTGRLEIIRPNLQISFGDQKPNNKERNRFWFPLGTRATAAARLQTNTSSLDKQDQRALIRSPNKAEPSAEAVPTLQYCIYAIETLADKVQPYWGLCLRRSVHTLNQCGANPRQHAVHYLALKVTLHLAFKRSHRPGGQLMMGKWYHLLQCSFVSWPGKPDGVSSSWPRRLSISTVDNEFLCL